MDLWKKVPYMRPTRIDEVFLEDLINNLYHGKERKVVKDGDENTICQIASSYN